MNIDEANRAWGISKTLRTETGHRLCLHPGKCHRLHGHSYEWTVHLTAPFLLDKKRGMFADFGLLKEAMLKCIDERLDHKFVLNESDPLLTLVKDGFGPGVVVLSAEPTAENLATRIAADLARALCNPDESGLRSLTNPEREQAEMLSKESAWIELAVSVKETATSTADVSAPLSVWMDIRKGGVYDMPVPVWREE